MWGLDRKKIFERRCWKEKEKEKERWGIFFFEGGIGFGTLLVMGWEKEME